jgi:hypothetical protein
MYRIILFKNAGNKLLVLLQNVNLSICIVANIFGIIGLFISYIYNVAN